MLSPKNVKHNHLDELLSNFLFGEQYLENPVTEYLLQLFDFKQGRYTEHTVSIKPTVRTKKAVFP